MESDETRVLPKREKTAETPFEIGDRTILQMQNQDFAVGDEEFGTVVLNGRTQVKPVEAPPAAAAEDPLLRLEQKLDTALRMISALQHRLEALDATLARLLMR